jgi:hypothetical protein
MNLFGDDWGLPDGEKWGEAGCELVLLGVLGLLTRKSFLSNVFDKVLERGKLEKLLCRPEEVRTRRSIRSLRTQQCAQNNVDAIYLVSRTCSRFRN